MALCCGSPQEMASHDAPSKLARFRSRNGHAYRPNCDLARDAWRCCRGRQQAMARRMFESPFETKSSGRTELRSQAVAEPCVLTSLEHGSDMRVVPSLF